MALIKQVTGVVAATYWGNALLRMPGEELAVMRCWAHTTAGDPLINSCSSRSAIVPEEQRLLNRVSAAMDSLTPDARSALMARIRGTGTKPELAVRSLMHRMGLRFRLHDRQLPGSPDIVLRRHHAVVFVHGCFWHRHGCPMTTTPKTRPEFWRRKFDANQARDARSEAKLRELGWRVLVIWECEVRDLVRLEERVRLFFGAGVDLGAVKP